MHMFLIRHALPVHSAEGDGADPPLSDAGRQMADRLPLALERHRITRVVTSPQVRAKQTAEPLIASTGAPVVVEERFAEYDFGLTEYTPVEQLRINDPAKLARLIAGQLPDGVDSDAFKARVLAAARETVANSTAADRVAVISHGGAINVLLQHALGTAKIFPFNLDYASVTQLRCRSNDESHVLGVNNIEHVWDLLPRLNRAESRFSETGSGSASSQSSAETRE